MGDGMQGPSPQSKRVLAGMRATVRPIGMRLPASPAGVRAARILINGVMSPLTRSVRDGVEQVETHAGGHRVRGEWVRPPGSRDDAAILYLHGSGFIACSPGTHRGLVWRLCRETGLPAFVSDYRLAPEHRFPAAHDDAFGAYRLLLESGFDPQRIVVAGDSAGGHLSIELSLRALAAGLPARRCLYLLSPLIQPDFPGAHGADRSIRDPFVTPDLAKRMVGLYTKGADPRDARLDLMLAELGGLPPHLIQVGQVELLADQCERFAHASRKAGNDCELTIWPGQVHVFQAFAAAGVPEAKQALRLAGEFIRTELGLGERPVAVPEPDAFGPGAEPVDPSADDSSEAAA